jgi:exosome complex exonuclease RRP6
MLFYARSDTHFLLYIYDNLRNALLNRAQTFHPKPSSSVPTNCDPAHILIYEVLARSEGTSLRVYEKEVYDAEEGSGPGGWDTMAKKWNKTILTKGASWNIQRDIYKQLHAWRDRVAREEDESRM